MYTTLHQNVDRSFVRSVPVLAGRVQVRVHRRDWPPARWSYVLTVSVPGTNHASGGYRLGDVDGSNATGRHIVIVGGGVSGLTTAYYLCHQQGLELPQITVLESAPTLGGKVVTADIAGIAVDTGPDAVLSRSPELRSLIDELGLRESVRGPLTSGAYVWSKNKLRLLPPGAAFGIPEKLWPLLKSGLLSPLGVIRAAGDFVLPKCKSSADPSVADITRP